MTKKTTTGYCKNLTTKAQRATVIACDTERPATTMLGKLRAGTVAGGSCARSGDSVFYISTTRKRQGP